MKRLLYLSLSLFTSTAALAQITITAADMPVSGDTLRYSIGDISTFSFNVADSGVSKAWDYTAITRLAQGVDTFKSAFSVNPTYALTISPSAYGYKIADSFPGLKTILSISFNNLYTFFNKKTSPPRFVAEGFAAVIGGVPTPANYSDEDEWYIFPLSYLSTDSTTFSLKFSLPGTLAIKQAGSRKTRVDGWGTIRTPYFTSPTNCIRVRSDIREIDSFDITIAKLGLPRNSTEYKFLVNGSHYPALWVTTTMVGGKETVSSVRYYDPVKTTGAVRTVQSAYQPLRVIPNPAGNEDEVTLELPANWLHYTVELFDLQSRLITTQQDNRQIRVKELPSGTYVLRVSNGSESGIAVMTR